MTSQEKADLLELLAPLCFPSEPLPDGVVEIAEVVYHLITVLPVTDRLAVDRDDPIFYDHDAQGVIQCLTTGLPASMCACPRCEARSEARQIEAAE